MRRFALVSMAGLLLGGCGTAPTTPPHGAVARQPGATKSAIARAAQAPVAGSPVALSNDRRLEGAAAGGSLALTVTLSENGAAPAPTAKPVPPAGAWNTDAAVLRAASFKGCLLGSTTPAGLETPESMARQLGRPLDIRHSFYNMDSTVPSAADRADVAAGRVPLISFNSHHSNREVKWAAIAAGAEDAKLHEVARGLKALGKPVFFTFNHEPENDGTRGTPAEYRAAWRHVSDILAQEKATNVVKVLIIMGFKNVDEYYPGDDVVDWIGGDPYNWAFTPDQPTAKWKAFDQVVSLFYTWGSKYKKPMLLGETGCSEDPSDPDRKAQWLRGMGASAKRLPLLKAICYFNEIKDDGHGLKYWYVQSAPARAAFREVAMDPYFAIH